MARSQQRSVRQPGGKYAHLQKKMQTQKTQGKKQGRKNR